jgi:branched-chain amino acid transport system substrate-binding protein
MVRSLILLLAALLALPLSAEAQKPIKVGVPLPLSGPPALFGEPASKGAQMYVDEINAKGGVLGRRIELLIRDSKADANEAVRVAEGPAVSVVAKENKIVFIAPIPKTDQLTAADKLHPYVFRVAANTTMEGRSAAEIVAKWPVTRIATIAFDYAYGQDVTRSFVEHIKRLKPGVEIVDQQWPKLGEQDYNPFINAQMAKKPEAVVSSIWGGFFVTFSKQAKALGYFDAIKYNFIGLGEAGSPETTKSMGADYPVGIWGNSYDAFYWEDNPGPHKDYTARLSKYLKDEYPSSWAIQGYIGMAFLVEAIKKAGSTDSDKVSKALLGLTIDTPIGKQTLREKDHQANRGQLYGKTVKDPKYNFPIMKPITYVDPTKFMD